MNANCILLLNYFYAISQQTGMTHRWIVSFHKIVIFTIPEITCHSLLSIAFSLAFILRMKKNENRKCKKEIENKK